MAIYVSIKPTQNISRLDMILINRELLQLLENLCQYTGDEHLVELVRNCVKSFISIDWGAIYKEHYKELGSQWTGEQDAENTQAGSF